METETLNLRVEGSIPSRLIPHSKRLSGDHITGSWTPDRSRSSVCEGHALCVTSMPFTVFSFGTLAPPGGNQPSAVLSREFGHRLLPYVSFGVVDVVAPSQIIVQAHRLLVHSMCVHGRRARCEVGVSGVCRREVVAPHAVEGDL